MRMAMNSFHVCSSILLRTFPVLQHESRFLQKSGLLSFGDLGDATGPQIYRTSAPAFAAPIHCSAVHQSTLLKMFGTIDTVANVFLLNNFNTSLSVELCDLTSWKLFVAVRHSRPRKHAPGSSEEHGSGHDNLRMSLPCQNE